MKPVFLGLDGEMSGCDSSIHKLISIGLARSELQSVSFRIGWKECAYDPESLAVSGISYEEIVSAPRAELVDRQLVQWCEDQSIEEGSIIPIGWAVSTFDLPYVRSALPLFSAYLHHHCVELNAICYTMAENVPYLASKPDRLEWKMMATKVAELRLNLGGTPPAWHDAEYDAMAAIVAWDWLRKIVRDGGPTVVSECDVGESWRADHGD